MKKQKRVSIGIPAYNEAANINNLLQSLLIQKQQGFIVSEIIVNSDASTDKTVDKVRLLQKENPIIRVLSHKERKGKYFRVNQLLHSFTGDILILLDADIVPVGEYFIATLVEAIAADPQAKMIAAHNILLRPQSFIGKAICANFSLWDFIRWSIPEYDHAANFYGTATALPRDFARSISIPANLNDPHLFLYLVANKQNGFRYCRKAEVLQNSITNISDYVKFYRRTIGKKDKTLEKLFGIKTEEVYYFPRKYKLLGLWKALLSQPFYTPLGILLSIYAEKQAAHKINTRPIWDITPSSKKSLSNYLSLPIKKQ